MKASQLQGHGRGTASSIRIFGRRLITCSLVKGEQLKVRLPSMWYFDELTVS